MTMGGVLHSQQVRTLLLTYFLFTICEYALWIAMLVYAYQRGGATTAGVVAVVQLLPSAAVALAADPLTRRRSVGSVLIGAYLLQALGAAATAVAVLTGAPSAAAYAGAVVVSATLTLVRPVQSAALPALATDPAQLTAANVALGVLESVSVLVAGALTGVALGLAGVGEVFAGAAGLLLVCAALSWPLRRVRTHAELPADAPPTPRHLPVPLPREARTLVGLIGTENAVVGALDILFVVLAVDVLSAGSAWTGYLNTAYGAGALLLGGAAVWLTGRPMGPLLLATAAMLGVCLAATVVGGLWPVAALLVVVGGMRAVFDLGARILLQRSVPPDQLPRVFGLTEGLSMLGLCAGSLLVPLLVAVSGPELALLGTAALLPVHVALRTRTLLRIDRVAVVPVVEIALLRQVPLFRYLPAAETEALARSLARVELAPGEALVRQGDPGDRWFAIAEGDAVVEQDGARINEVGRGDGVGEIALLHDVRRTATVRARTPVVAYAMDREDFLGVVTAHGATLELARDHAASVVGRDEARRRSGS